MAPLRTWFRATQPRSFVASLVGVALGAAVAWNHAQLFDLVAFLLAAIGVVCLHAATNMSNDSIDYKRGVDDLPAHLVSPFTGGARSEEHTSELQSQFHLVCSHLIEKKKKQAKQ